MTRAGPFMLLAGMTAAPKSETPPATSGMTGAVFNAADCVCAGEHTPARHNASSAITDTLPLVRMPGITSPNWRHLGSDTNTPTPQVQLSGGILTSATTGMQGI